MIEIIDETDSSIYRFEGKWIFVSPSEDPLIFNFPVFTHIESDEPRIFLFDSEQEALNWQSSESRDGLYLGGYIPEYITKRHLEALTLVVKEGKIQFFRMSREEGRWMIQKIIPRFNHQAKA